MAGKLPASKRRSTISISDMPGLTRSGAISYISTKRSLQTIRRWSESKKQSPCDMLLMAVSNWKFLTRSVSLLPAEFVLLLQPGIELFALGDVLVGRHPAAAGHRVDGVGDDPAVSEFLHRGVERDVAADARADVLIGFELHLEAEIEPMLNQFTGRCARLHLFRRQPVHFPVTAVAENNFALLVKN